MSALCSLLATTAWVYAQDQPKPAEEPRPDATKPAQDEKPKQDEMKSPHQNEAKPAKPEQKQPQKDMKQQEKEMKQDDAKSAKQRSSVAQSGQNVQRSGNHGGGRIPDDKFHAHFGRQHTFVIHQTTVVQGQPGFQYGGYSFILVDPWPAGWAYTDDCYVDYVNGEYFLFDLLHPGVQVALTVVL